MKRFKLLALIITAILIPMIAVLAYLSPISQASSFVYQYNVTNGAPPFVTNIDGKDTEVYCSQSGGSLWSSWRLTFYSQDTHSMSPGLAYALRQCCSINSRQNLVWMSEISDNITTPSWKPDYDDALIQYNKIAGFNEYYSKLQEAGKEVKFEDTNATLQDSENGVFKLGPFKVSFYKSAYSGISKLYLKTDVGTEIEVNRVNFGGYTGSVSDIDSGEEFYVLLSQADAGQASKVSLVAEYKYEEASGTYTYYKPDKSHQTMDGRTVQRLVTIDYTGGPQKDDADSPEIELTIDLAGKVFKDNLANKDGTEDGIISTGDEMLEGIEVTLFDSTGAEIAKTTTDKDGYYEFKDQPASKQYYVRFKYNGQLYEPTTYQRVSKIIDNAGTLGPTTIAERSYATDGKQNRQNFNNKFTPVDSTHTVPDRDDTTNAAFDIYAYTGPNGMEELKYYGVSNSKEELLNINFGIKDREQFDMNLRKDLVKVDLHINGKSHTYNYPGGEQDLEVDIRGTDIPDYNRAIRSSDLQYKAAAQYDQDPDKLQVIVTYKIQLRNQSVGKITGYVTDLADYYDTSYEYIRSYDENEKDITWEQQSDISGSGKTYHTMHTTALADQGIDDKKWIFVEYKVTNDALRALLEEGSSTKENFAQISGYRNTYREERKDLNGQVITNAGENAGLIDVDSTPANLNPTDSRVQEFVAYSKTEEYQALGGEEKTKQSMAIFEDDADAAPGLKLIVDDANKRRLTGTVFEDAALAEKLKNDNERIGDGAYEDGDNLVNQVKVQLICTNGDVEVKEARTNDQGAYEFTDYIPGDYTVKFTYGDYESLIAVQPNSEMYTGQDYKSTIYQESNYSDTYWYNNNIDTKINDAKDDQTRREEVNKYSEDLKYTNATVLNSTAQTDEATLRTLADKTNMNANTAQMSMEIEYVGQENTEYSVRNIDFGIIERPRSDIYVEKTVSNLKLSTAGDGQTIFNSNQSVSNLTWKPNTRENRGLIQATVDENLLHGATLELTFSIKVVNTGETDYDDETYYNTGVITDVNKIVTLDPAVVADYVSNNLSFDISKNSGWQEITDKTVLTSGDDPYIKAVDENAFNGLQKVIVSTSDNPIVQSDPLVPEKAKDKAGKQSETQSATVFLTKVIASDGSTTDDTEYENTAEVIESITTNGRRTYNADVVSIPGNYNLGEPDTAQSERIAIVPPFGAADAVKYILIGIAIIGVLGVGIFLIKRKVLTK
ncbi:MAG: SdrD B-like domain-containing protein [Clostridia bacterium]|jgi:hypothetical protein|nr:hypothetical protein [Clostridium sp.]MBS5863844.1 hypothetical protein [Clostridium sp.]MEE0268302.1 SdrD B-like domain-containing protein [Clostridia bacterium]